MNHQVSILFGCLTVLASACGGSLTTGAVSRPDASPQESPCSNDTTQCGSGPAPLCIDLQTDPAHCGSCHKACAPGVACAAGVCQRVVCQGQPVLSGSPITSTPMLDFAFRGAVFADVNGDGHLDLVTMNNPTGERDPPFPDGRKIGPGSFSVSLGQGGGRFAATQSYTTPSWLRGVQVADVNYDGADDLLLLQMGSPCREVWLGHADGSLTARPMLSIGAECGWAMAIADFSGDGYLDVVVESNPFSEVHVYLSNDTGTLQSSGAYAVPDPSELLVRDWNGDGLPDLVSLGPSTLSLLINRGAGIFDPAVDCGLALNYKTVVSDLDRDGHTDLATVQSYGVEVLRGLGGCRFTSVAGFDTPVMCDTLQPADMDGDGLMDLVCVSNDLFTGLMANPDGSLQATAPIRLVGADGLDAILVGDVTGDGRPDVLTADRHGPVSVWENTCP